MCGAHAAVRSILGEIVDANRQPTVVDIEAGLEHLSRGTARHVDTLIAVVEPYFKSMETGARVTALARELGIARVLTVANKVRSDEDARALDEFCRGRDMDLVATIPDDEPVREADRRGVAPLDLDSGSAAVNAVRTLAERLQES